MEQVDFENDKATRIYRVEKNKVETVFLYVRQYPNDKSALFAQERSVIVFYFDDKFVNKKFIKPYLELAGKVEKIKLGSYFNNRGNSKKRVKVFFAAVLFKDTESVTKVLDWDNMQTHINALVEYKRHQELQLKYNPNQEEQELDEEDEDGFVTVRENSKLLISR